MVDLTDTSMAASGTTKKVTVNQILQAGGTATLASATITGAATVGTTFGVTGASTFTGAATFNGAATLNGNTTLGDAQTDTATINGQLTARQGEFPSAVRAAASDYAAVAFDGATTNTRITSTLTGQNIGTGDFSLWSRFRVPALAAFASNPGIIALGPNATDGGGNSSIRVILLSGGTLSVRINDGAGATTNGDIANFATNFAGQVIDLIVTRTGSTLKVYINGTDTAYTGTPAASESINSVYCHVGIGGAGGAIFNGRIYRSVVFNRALSAADVVEVGTTGVNPADQWGTQTQLGFTNGNFEADSAGTTPPSNWIASGNHVATVVADASVEGSKACEVVASGAGSSATGNDNLQHDAPVRVAGKRYRMTFSARTISGNNVLSWAVGAGDPKPQGAFTTTLTGSYVVYANEFICNTTTSGTTRIALAAAGTFRIDNVFFERIGAIVDLDFTVGAGYQATDRSTNALHGTLFNGVEFTVPKKVAVVYATTNTNGNQQMLGTLAIPTNAIIEDIIVNSTGSATVSVGNASAGTQIVNGASVVSGRQKLTIATPFSTTGNLWVNSNATATLQFTILYTIAS
jgi:hypothetical protein